MRPFIGQQHPPLKSPVFLWVWLFEPHQRITWQFVTFGEPFSEGLVFPMTRAIGA
jgi:hypothetical protein